MSGTPSVTGGTRSGNRPLGLPTLSPRESSRRSTPVPVLGSEVGRSRPVDGHTEPRSLTLRPLLLLHLGSRLSARAHRYTGPSRGDRYGRRTGYGPVYGVSTLRRSGSGAPPLCGLRGEPPPGRGTSTVSQRILVWTPTSSTTVGRGRTSGVPRVGRT